MPLRYAVIAALLMFVSFAGCAARRAEPPHAMSSALWSDVPAPAPKAISAAADPGTAPFPEPRGAITLRDAVTLAVAHNPDLAAASWETVVQDAGVLQAGARPNPEIEFEAEEFGGAHERRGFDSAEVSVRLSQVLELGAKRAGRMRAASLDRTLSGWDYEIRRLDTLAGVTKAFIDVLAAQEKNALARENLDLAGSFLSAAAERVRAGKIPPLEESRARAALAAERIGADMALRELADARAALAASWGGTSPVFASAKGSLDSIAPVPMIDIEKVFANNPDMARWAVRMERHAAAVEVEKSRRMPDVAITGGGTRFMAGDENAVVAGLTVPVPLFDRNRGNVDMERARLAKAREERRAESVAVRKSLLRGCRDLASAYEQAIALSTDVIPAARSAFDAAIEGYRAGKYSYLDVLETRRAYIEARVQAIGALAAYHGAAADIERLTGEPLDTVLKTTP